MQRYPALAARLLDEDEGLVIVVEAEGESSVHAQLRAQVAITDRLGDAAAGAVVELGDGPTAGSILAIYGKGAIRMGGIFRKRIFQVRLDKHRIVLKNVLKNSG